MSDDDRALARRQALEEAAKTCEEYVKDIKCFEEMYRERAAADVLANRIRRLIESDRRRA